MKIFSLRIFLVTTCSSVTCRRLEYHKSDRSMIANHISFFRIHRRINGSYWFCSSPFCLVDRQIDPKIPDYTDFNSLKFSFQRRHSNSEKNCSFTGDGSMASRDILATKPIFIKTNQRSKIWNISGIALGWVGLGLLLNQKWVTIRNAC